MYGEYTILDAPVPVKTCFNTEMFSNEWSTAEPPKARSVALDADAVDRARTIIERALSKYNSLLTLKSNLYAVYMLPDLGIWSSTKNDYVSVSGTNSTDNVYLKLAASFSDDWVECTFHCEFSSILLRKHATHYWDAAAWDALNPSDFEYGSSGVDAITQNAASKVFDPDLYAQGFLYPYAQSTPENDFNAFASCLFMLQDEFKAACSHEKVRSKAHMVIDFYDRIGFSGCLTLPPAPPQNVTIREIT